MNDKITTHQAEDDARNQDVLIYVNGTLKPRSEAVVNVYDSGFMLGDGVWEGLRLYNGTWAVIAAHLSRLQEAAKAIDLAIGLMRLRVVAFCFLVQHFTAFRAFLLAFTYITLSPSGRSYLHTPTAHDRLLGPQQCAPTHDRAKHGRSAILCGYREMKNGITIGDPVFDPWTSHLHAVPTSICNACATG